MEHKQPKTLLWKVYLKDPEICHYVFGTIHTATQEAMTFRELAEACIDRTSIYAGEMDLNAVDEKAMMKYLMLPEGTSLQDLFTVRKYKNLRKIIAKTYHLDLDDLNQFTPFYISNIIAERSLHRTAPTALDHALWAYATLAGKEMHGLESFEEQCEIMQQIPLEFQVKAFKNSFKNLNRYRKNVERLNILYAQGELDSLYKSSKRSMGGIRKLMIYDRNKVMVERCIALFNQKSSFIAVGAAHLAGNNGILPMLKRSGYTIKMVRSLADI